MIGARREAEFSLYLFMRLTLIILVLLGVGCGEDNRRAENLTRKTAERLILAIQNNQPVKDQFELNLSEMGIPDSDFELHMAEVRYAIVKGGMPSKEDYRVMLDDAGMVDTVKVVFPGSAREKAAGRKLRLDLLIFRNRKIYLYDLGGEGRESYGGDLPVIEPPREAASPRRAQDSIAGDLSPIERHKRQMLQGIKPRESQVKTR